MRITPASSRPPTRTRTCTSRSRRSKDHGPFAALFEAIDRDGDGKLYMKEVDAFVDRQAEAARSQLVLSASDQGRAIFAIVDLNRDRQLGVREIRGAVARASSWDHDGDGRIRSDEIPHHYQLTIGRGQITGIGMARFRVAAMESPAGKPAAAGPVVVPQDGPQPRRRRLPPRVPRPPRRVRPPRPRSRRPDRRSRRRRKAVAKSKKTAAR